MNFELSESQELLSESVRRFLAENAPIDPYVRGQLEDLRGTSDTVWKGLAELGVLGLSIAEEHGGAGLGMLDMGVVCDEMGRALHPGPFFSTALAVPALLDALDDAGARAEWLPALAAGERIASVALYEPGQRYAWRRPGAAARPDGRYWRVSGTKSSVLDAHAAQLCLVIARDERSGELGVFATELSDESVALEPVSSVDGTRKQGRLSLRDAQARRIGRGDATGAVAAALDRMVIGWVADGLGAASRAFELALDYARERTQFDRPIGSFQAVQHMLVDMLRDLELCRAGTYYALWAADAADPAERHRAATMAKAYASRALPQLGAAAIQIFGGVGFTWEYDIHLYYKRLLSLQHAFGDEAEQLDELAQIAIDGTTAREGEKR